MIFSSAVALFILYFICNKIMKAHLLIFFYLCLLFPACKAKTDNKSVRKKAPDKITAAMLPVKKTDDDVAGNQTDKADITGKITIIDKADTSNQNEDLKSWKERVSKDLKPVLLKTKTTPTVSISAKGEKISAKKTHKKEMTTANRNTKIKIAETTKKLDLSKENNFGKTQSIEHQDPQ